MSNQQSAWDQYIKDLGNSTGRFGGEDTICCHICGKWIETTMVHFSRYDGEPLCTGCAEADGTEKNGNE